MSHIAYQNFYIRIARKNETKKSYSVSVTSDSGGEASGEFIIDELLINTSALSVTFDHPSDSLSINRNAKLVGSAPTNSESQLQRVYPPSFDESKQLGAILFNTIFRKCVRDNLSASLGVVRNSNSSVRLRFQLNLTDSPELAVLPWEYIYNADIRHFYAQAPETPLVRYLDKDWPAGLLTVDPPLQMLVALASPIDQPKLDVQKEYQGLKQALEKLESQRLIQIDCLEKTSAATLINRLMEKDYHILHFIGHGSFQSGAGALVFEDEQGGTDLIDGNVLARRLANFDSLRLGVINACEGANSSNSDSYAGVAQSLLINGNLPAVIAMQFAITDKAAIRFARFFYDALADENPVDAAMSFARTQMIEREDIEWATPVLFMRAKSGELFNLSKSGIIGTPTPTPNLEADPSYSVYQEMLGALRDGQMVFFLGLEANLYDRTENADWQPGLTLPSNRELAVYLTRELGLRLDEPASLASTAQKAVANRKQSQLNTILRRVFTSKDLKPLPLHRFLSELIWRAQQDKKFILSDDPLVRRFIIVTTMYDNLVEKAFTSDGVGGNPVPNYHVLSYQNDDVSVGKFLHVRYAGSLQAYSSLIEQPNEYKELANDDFPVIIKLPGAIEGMALSYAIAEDNFFPFAGRSLPKLLPPQLMIKLQNSRHLYLGYRVRDWPLRALLYSIWGAARQRMESWAVLPSADPGDTLFWQSSDVRVIESAYDSFIEGLRRTINAQFK